VIGHSFYSAANRRRFAHYTWVPPDASGPLPVVILLHGVYDAGIGWWQDARAGEVAAALVASGQLPPFALVVPSDTGAEQGSGYCDWRDGTTFAETYVIGELLPWIAAELPGGGGLHVGGLSMGGYGSMLLALRNPGVFESASSTSGFFDPRRLFDFVPDASARMWGDDATREAHDVRALVADPRRSDGLRIALDCGTEDSLIGDNREFSALLKSLNVPHGYAESPGAHEWTYWSRRLEQHLRFHLGRGGDLAAS